MSAAPFVAFDLDDVLANLRDHLMDVLNRHTGRSIHWQRWDRYELSGVYDLSVEQILDLVLKQRVLEAATLEPLAQAALTASRAAGYRVAVVTARGWHPRGEALTRAWLERHGLRVDALHLVSSFDGKAAALGALGEVAHFVDDHVGHLYPALELPRVRQVHLLDRPWNRYDRTLPRVHGLQHFIDLLASPDVATDGPKSWRA
jgi:hypothetical protein